jgi:hypothetical protein
MRQCQKCKTPLGAGSGECCRACKYFLLARFRQERREPSGPIQYFAILPFIAAFATVQTGNVSDWRLLGFGLISLLQIAFLPGFVALKLVRFRCGLLSIVLFSLALSLVLNYLFVFFATVIGAYSTPVLRALVVLELAILPWALYRDRTTGVTSARVSPPQNAPTAPGENYWRHILCVPAALSVIFTLTYYGYQMHRDLGSIFAHWDAVVSWNRWAVDWASNRLPNLTLHYPQLLPANISVSYVLMGDSRIQFFAKSLMWVFPIGILLAQTDLGYRLKAPLYFLAVPLTALLLHRTLGTYEVSGYADVPTAFMAFAAYHALLLGREPGADRQSHVVLGAVFAGGALLTKQAAAFPALLYPFLAYVLVAKDDIRERKWQSIAYAAAVVLILCLPWYLYKEVQIYRSIDQSEIQEVTSSPHLGRDYGERLVFGLNSLYESLGPGVVAVCIVGLLAALADRTWRWLLLLFILPYSLIWAFLYSYDLRNLTVALPFAATAAAAGINCLVLAVHRATASRVQAALRATGSRVLITAAAAVLVAVAVGNPSRWLEEWVSFRANLSPDVLRILFLGLTPLAFYGTLKVSRWQPFVLFVALPYAVLWGQFFDYEAPELLVAAPLAAVFLAFVLRRIVAARPWLWFAVAVGVGIGASLIVSPEGVTMSRVTDKALIARQQVLQRQIVDREINEALYEYDRSSPFAGKVLTGYFPMAYLPELGHLCANFYNVMTSERLMLKQFAHGDIRYILLLQGKPGQWGPRDYVEEGVRTGKFRSVLSHPKFDVWEVVGPVP